MDKLSTIGTSPMLDAFVDAAYGGYDEIKKAHDEADAKATALAELQKEAYKQAKQEAYTEHYIADYIDISTAIKKGSLDQITVEHPNLKGYDHSLEMNRLPSLREKYDYIAPEPSSVNIKDTKMSTKPYENINPSKIPSMNGIFDNVFKTP